MPKLKLYQRLSAEMVSQEPMLRSVQVLKQEVDDLDAQCRTRPRYFHILQNVQVSNGLNHYFLSHHTHTHTHTQRERHEYSIVAVDEPQL